MNSSVELELLSSSYVMEELITCLLQLETMAQTIMDTLGLNLNWMLLLVIKSKSMNIVLTLRFL